MPFANPDNLLHTGMPWGQVVELGNQINAIAAGIGSASFAPTGNISVNLTPIANSATANSAVMMSYSLPANSFNATGQQVYIEAWGTFAANAQNKQLWITVGGMTFASGSSTGNGSTWVMRGRVYRSGASAQVAQFEGQIGASAVAMASSTDTSVETSAITISLKALSGSASGTDITQNGLKIQYFG